MKLLQNEWMKLWSKKSSFVMLLLVVALAIAPAFLIKSLEPEEDTNWKAEVRDQIQTYEEILQQDELDESSQQYYEAELAVAQYHLDQNIAPTGTTFASYMQSELELFSIFLTLFAVIVAAGIVSNEFSTGTIKMLLTRPVKRWKILLSKLMTTILFWLSLYALGMIVAAITGALLFGVNSPPTFEFINGQIEEFNAFTYAAKFFMLSLSNFFMSILLAFMIGAVFTSSSLAIGFTLFLSLMSKTIVMLLSEYAFVRYLWITHIDLTQYMPGYETLLPNMTFTGSIIINSIYACAFVVITFIVFLRRDVTA